MNLTTLPLPAGKTLSKPQVNLLGFMSSLGVTAPASNQSRTNPFTRATHELTPLGCAIYDFVVNTRNPGMGPLTYAGQKVQVAQWDRARYLFLHLYPEQYYSLLD